MLIDSLRRFNRILDRFSFWMTAVAAILFSAIIIAAVISRSVFQKPIQASEEFSNLFFIWACFGGAALCYRRRQHIQFLYFVEKLPPGWQRPVRTACDCLVLTFLLIVFYQSIVMIYLLRVTSMPISGLSQFWLYLSVPAFALVMAFYALEFIFEPAAPARDGK